MSDYCTCLGVFIPSTSAGNPSTRVKVPSTTETSKWERSQLLVPSTSAGKLVLMLGVKWERLGVNIQMVPSTSAGNQLGIGWESKFWWFPSLVLGSSELAFQCMYFAKYISCTILYVLHKLLCKSYKIFVYFI